MKCPHCQSKMKRELMEDRVPVYRCVSCAGTWVSSSEFADWVEGQSSVPVKEEISKESVNIRFLEQENRCYVPIVEELLDALKFGLT